MVPEQNQLNQELSDQQTDGGVTRRSLAKKVAYIAPAVLAVIAAADRPALAASQGPPA
jgi:hypothetical protein